MNRLRKKICNYCLTHKVIACYSNVKDCGKYTELLETKISDMQKELELDNRNQKELIKGYRNKIKELEKNIKDIDKIVKKGLFEGQNSYRVLKEIKDILSE